ncbi:MOSC domain-containing protein [Nocardiopsis gilva YIM 90087]|uniref:MOSC domain-containing protein n=1 Tax=Nocardiopsis gilva YIM 90087 TaxID=1235441 RepID=A0A223S7H8_9ACTN|nr:MOSC N-terminal beta barrel domain-containing protein [Nocardiopsis gilva]ASU84085.1 MOSC domain-containing protein [Nocardiopsis gilva YIM 90087]
MVVVRELNVFPLKSMGGNSLTTAEVTATGLLHDREFMLIRPDRRHISQREVPELALLRPDYDGVKLTVHAAHAALPLVHVPVDGPAMEVTVHGRPCRGIDQGDAAAAWFSDALGCPCRLVRFTGERRTLRNDGSLRFADGYPLSVLSRESLDDLNRRAGSRLPMHRFRPNIVLEGLGAYGEDTVSTLRIGTVEIDLARPCARCVIINIDQDSARKSPEPLRALASYRTQDFDGGREIMFGRLGVPRAPGVIAVGDTVQTSTIDAG